LDGGAGNDVIYSDAGSDTINGGSGTGFDYYSADYSNRRTGLTMTYDPTTGNGTITIGSEVDTLISIESFIDNNYDGQFTGTAFDDVIVGTSANDQSRYGGLFGGDGNDTISGGAGDDKLYGQEDNDVLNGELGNDALYGGNGNDTLQGTNNGTGEQDYLEGGTGSDLFILADTTKTFYDDGNATNAGTNDYARIADFNTTDDIIQLRGSSSDYLLSVSGSNTNLHINKPGSEPDELIAVINNQTALSLTASYFSYSSSPTLPTITLAVSPSSVTEDGTTNLVYTFTRSGVTTNALTVNYTVGGTATNGTDYTSIPTSVTFAANSSTATVTVDPTADTTVEPDETVALTLATGTGYTVGTPDAATGTITNDDVTLPSITLAVSPSSVTEDGTTNLVYTFTRSGVTTNPLTVNYTIGGTATNGTDYTSIPTSVTFAANSSTATVIVDPTADTTVESDETVALTLATGTGYTVGTTTAVTGTITNDDLPSITLAVSPSSVTEDGTSNLIYIFMRTGDTTNPLTVNYTVGGTATNGTDYTSIPTTVIFESNSAIATVIVDPTADTTVESNETVILTLATGTGYTVGTTTAVTGTITNDDVTLPSITLAVSPSSVTEDGTTNLVYTFTRSGVTTNALTVNYTIGGTATNGTDYTSIPTSVTFAANSSTATLIVDPTADTTVESNETVALTLATGTGYTVGTTTAVTGTITNDDTSVTPIEAFGNTKLVKDTTNKLYTQIGNNNPIAINISGTQITTNIYPGWQTLAAETVNGVNQVLWKYNDGNYLHLWSLDSNWNWQSSTGWWGLNSSEAFTQETNFQQDFNGDGVIGQLYTPIEAFGNTKLVKDTTNKLYTQIGNNNPIAINISGT
ncbi:MAG: hypothetical protein GPJ09_21425, partial [Microcystis aeruginosa SX13-01]|nr:hypothetical protein [Microcystis aeruginosa SX13-01]